MFAKNPFSKFQTRKIHIESSIKFKKLVPFDVVYSSFELGIIKTRNFKVCFTETERKAFKEMFGRPVILLELGCNRDGLYVSDFHTGENVVFDEKTGDAFVIDRDLKYKMKIDLPTDTRITFRGENVELKDYKFEFVSENELKLRE